MIRGIEMNKTRYGLLLLVLLCSTPAMAQSTGAAGEAFCFGMDTTPPAGSVSSGRVWILAMPASGTCPAGALAPVPTAPITLSGTSLGTQHLATTATAMVVPAGTMYATVIPHADGSLDVTYFK